MMTLRSPQTPLNWKFMQDWIFPFNFEPKNRKIEISKIVDTSGPKIRIFQNFPPSIFFNPRGPRGYLINPWGPRGPIKNTFKNKVKLRFIYKSLLKPIKIGIQAVLRAMEMHQSSAGMQERDVSEASTWNVDVGLLKRGIARHSRF